MSEANEVRLGLCQIHVEEDKAKNLEAAAEGVREAARQGAQVVMLPEMFNCPYSTDSFGPYSEELPETAADVDPERHPTSAMIRDLAVELGVYLVGGSMPERDAGTGRLYNTCLVADPSGEFVARHRKAHLFDISVPGQITFRESDRLTGGDKVTVFDTAHGRMALGICYDIRFPEYAQVCADLGARVLLYPGAFNTTTGPPHWLLLQRARAVDNQLFVATCSPARNPDSSYQAWGHSTVVDPWGDVVATAGHEPAVVLATLPLAKVDETRQRIPVRVQKRHDLYTSPQLLRGRGPAGAARGLPRAAVAAAAGAAVLGAAFGWLRGRK